MLKIIMFVLIIILVILIAVYYVYYKTFNEVYSETIQMNPGCIIIKAINVNGLEKSKNASSFLPFSIIVATADSYQFLTGRGRHKGAIGGVGTIIGKKYVSSLAIENNYKVKGKNINALVFKVNGEDDIVFHANKNSQLLIDDYDKYKQSIETNNN